MARLITHACMVFCLLRSLLAARFCAVCLRVDLISSIFVLVWAMFSHLFRFHLGARELVALVAANPSGFLLPFFCYLIVSWVVVVFGLVFARQRLQAGGGRAGGPLRTALCDCLALPKSLVVSIASSEFFLSDLFPAAAFRGRRACF